MTIRDPYRREVARLAARLGTALSGVAVVVTLLGMGLAATPGSAAGTNAGAATVAGRLQSGPRLGTRRAQHRRQTEQETRHQRNDRGERKDTGIDADGLHIPERYESNRGR